MTAKEIRKLAKKNSSLPYSFEYKIRRAFYGEKCPICNCNMERYEFCDIKIPSIQHNIPLSIGGLHELGNISVICRSCNSSIRDNITPELNADIVTKVWHEMV